MSPLFTSDTESAPDESAAGSAPESHRIERPGRRRIDSNAVRWVLAATIAFWLTVYEAGSHFF